MRGWQAAQPGGQSSVVGSGSEFRMWVLQGLHSVSLDATERMVRDRLRLMRFCGFGILDSAPDANTLRDFRETRITADALEALFQELARPQTSVGDKTLIQRAK